MASPAPPDDGAAVGPAAATAPTPIVELTPASASASASASQASLSGSASVAATNGSSYTKPGASVLASVLRVLQRAASGGGGGGAGLGGSLLSSGGSSIRSVLSGAGDEAGSEDGLGDEDVMREGEEDAASLLLLHHHGGELDVSHGIDEEGDESDSDGSEGPGGGPGATPGDGGGRALVEGTTAAAAAGLALASSSSTTGGRSRTRREERQLRGAAAAFSLRSMLLLRRRQWRTMLRAHVQRGLEGAPGDQLRGPFSWRYVVWALLAGVILVACVGFASLVVLSGGVVLLWFVPPVATLIFCIQPRAAWPYTAAALVTVEVSAVVSGHGRISRDSIAAFLLVLPDLLSTALGTLVLRPLIAGSIGIVRSSTFIRYLGLYVLIITPSFSLISVAIIVLLPSNNINWVGGRQLVVAWVLGDFFANYFTLYAALVFRHAIAKATKESYRLPDLMRYIRTRLHEGGLLLKLRFVEFAGMLVVVYLVARSVAISSTSNEPGSRLVSRLMFPVLGLVTFRYGQFGSCLALIVAAAAIFIVTYGQLDRSERTSELTDIFYQIDLLLGPVLVILITWSFTYLAVALAEKQDALMLLKKRNVQLSVQGRELNEAKLEAQRALSTKTEFFARVSHEFRTPLNIILGFAEEIRRRPLSPYVQERIGYIITSGESLLRIVDDILELFRLSSQRLQIDVSEVDIHAYFTTLCDLVQVITDKSQRQLVRELDPSLPRQVLLDKIRFSQLIMNLTSNAAKFTGINGVIHIRLKRGAALPTDHALPTTTAALAPIQDNPQAQQQPTTPTLAHAVLAHDESIVWLQLEVEDDGIGIPSELQEQIFSCFFSGAHQPGAEKGHGLGLAITKELVDLMRGCISVRSEVGRGSVFTVLLPVTVVGAPPTKRQLPAALAGGGGGTAAAAGEHVVVERSSKPQQAQPPPALPVQYHQQQRTSPLAGFASIAERLGGPKKGAAAAAAGGGGGGGSSAPAPAPAAASRPSLPRPPAAPAGAAGAAGGAGGGRIERRLQGLRVLAVEDLLPNQMVLGGMLREDRHGVQFAETARGALELLVGHPEAFDAVLLDIELPDAHGVTVLDRVRGYADPRVNQIPVIVVTAVAMDGERARCYQHGADDFVTKPLRLATLRESLLRLYNRGRICPREGLGLVYVPVEASGGEE